MTIQEIERLDKECSRVKHEYLEEARRHGIHEMYLFIDMANQVEITRRAMWDYYQNGGSFSERAFEE